MFWSGLMRTRPLNISDTLKSAIEIIIYYLIKLLVPTNDRIWIFTSHGGSGFGENSKYQYLYSTRQDNVRAIWVSRDNKIVKNLQSKGFEAYSYHSIWGKYYLLRSGYMFFTHGWKLGPYSGNSDVIQLWHGNMLKKMGNDLNVDVGLIQRAYRRILGRNWDYFVVTSSSYPIKHAKSAFDLNEENILVAGYPRTDPIFRDMPFAKIGISNEIERCFQPVEDRTLFCHLPTWNGGRNNETRFSEKFINLEELDEILDSKDGHLIIKQHANTQSLINDTPYEHIDVLPADMDIYPFIDHIDVLITDYSSIFFDYLLLNRPIIFYPYDLEQYTENRGLYFSYKQDLPGEKADTASELNNVVHSILNGADEYSEKREQMCDEYFSFQDGNSSKRLHEHIINEIE